MPRSLFPTSSQSLMTIDKAVKSIKDKVEDVIVNGWTDLKGTFHADGCEAKNSLIRSQVLIDFIHDSVKSQFISEGVNPDLIKPELYHHDGEIDVYGFIKKKSQDVSVFPNNISPQAETLTSVGILNGERDEWGTALTEAILAVNVRSQLSSVSKNFDTLYERTFAEPLNLHLRCPKMVLGEVYMIPVYEYDDADAAANTVSFKPNAQVKKHLKKYINAFAAINGRTSQTSDLWLYERVCLLIVDFNHNQPIIYSSDAELKAAGLMDANATYSMNGLSFQNFSKDLLDIYTQRFGTGRFI